MKIIFQGLRVFIALIAIVLFVSGFQWSFIPQATLEGYGITADSALGINMLKSDVGAGLIGATIFLMMFAWRGGFWFYPAVILTANYLGIRVVSLVVDGSHPMIIMGIVLEAVVLVALLALRQLYARQEEDHSITPNNVEPVFK